jgi:spermidine/putrescine transport system substrate-binding protein
MDLQHMLHPLDSFALNQIRVWNLKAKKSIFYVDGILLTDIIDCFGLVYGVDVNVDYFSSNEELYTKISFGADVNPYDVIHPSDYMISVLIREGILQKLNQSKLRNTKNLDAGLVNAYGDTIDYLVPYQMGTQAIVYNSETVTNPPTS